MNREDRGERKAEKRQAATPDSWRRARIYVTVVLVFPGFLFCSSYAMSRNLGNRGCGSI